MNTFNLTGKIGTVKETDKFKPIETTTFDSGWQIKRCRFNCISGTNRVMLTAEAGKWSDDSKNEKIYTVGKAVDDGKAPKLEIPWSERFDQKNIESVANFRKYVISLGEDKRTEYIAEPDFVDAVEALIKNEEYVNSNFRILGTQELQYDAAKGRCYSTYHVQKIYLIADDVEEKTELRVDMFFTDDVWNDCEDRVVLKGFTKYYDSRIKANGFEPITIVLRDQPEAKLNRLKEIFAADEGEVKEIAFFTDIIDGAERKDIKLEDLSEDVKADIEMGLLDFDEVARSMGGAIYGDRLTEIRFNRLSSTCANDTAYSVTDLIPPKAKQTDEIPDLFDDDDDDDDDI